MRLSIKRKVALLCTLLTAMVAILALGLLLLGESRIQREQYRSTLLSTAELARNDLRYESGSLNIDRNLDDLPGVRLSLYTTEGDLIYGRHWVDVPFLENEMRRAQGLNQSEWFFLDTLLHFENGESIWMRCLRSADTADGILFSSTRLAVLLIPLLVFLAGLSGYAVARRAFRPVSRIVQTAESIADGADLKKRIALDGPQDELYSLASAFDAMFERLDASFERERRFTSDVSHELRTPISSILVQSELALSEKAGDADCREVLEHIHQKAASMAELVRRLLMLARMDAGQTPLSPEPLDLGMLAGIAADSLAAAAAEREIHVDTSGCEPIEILADQAMLTQAVLNLISNAIRHNHHGGWVRIYTQSTPGEIRLCVEDGGPGIPADHIPRLFERFYQADPSRHSGGSGLGLPLAELIARLHGGRITAESTPGKGSLFTLVLPGKEDAH